jgi:lipopolysaccharide transport system permease protein
MSSVGTTPDPAGSKGSPAPSASHRVEVIDPSGNSSLRASLAELWHYRDLVLILTKRDVSVRYKQAVFGFAWAVVQPLVLVAVFAFFLNGSGQVSSRGPYPAFALAGLIPWVFVSSSVLSGGESLVSSSNLVSKVYFPRLALPAAALLSWLPDLALSLVVLAVLMVVYGIVPTAAIAALPAFVVLAAVTALGVSVWTAALNVAYRDVKHAVPFIVQFWLFATPGIYTAHAFKGPLAAVVSINPMTGAVAGFRWALLGVEPPSWPAVAISSAVAVTVLITGLRYFRRTERYFADVV